MILRPLLKIAIYHINDIIKKCAATLSPSLPAYAVYASDNYDQSG